MNSHRDGNFWRWRDASLSRNRQRRLYAVLVGLALLIRALPAAAAIPQAERDALIAIYTSAGGDAWTQNGQWCSGACPASGVPAFNTAGSECGWYGIGCDGAQMHVVAINLSNNHLVGGLPDLAAFTSLQSFDVDFNALSGTLSAFDGLIALQTVQVRDNQFSGTIPSLAGLTALQKFWANSNRFTGSIPPLAALDALTNINLSDNQLSGTIPSLTGLTALQYFTVSGNRLTGSLPMLSGLTALFDFDASSNQLSGPVPLLTDLPALQFIGVAGNALSGAIPSLAALPAIFAVDFSDNRFTGGVPAAPSSLFAGSSRLCPNPLDTTPNGNDASWNSATGHTPWWATPTPSNRCDEVFGDDFESHGA